MALATQPEPQGKQEVWDPLCSHFCRRLLQTFPQALQNLQILPLEPIKGTTGLQFVPIESEEREEPAVPRGHNVLEARLS